MKIKSPKLRMRCPSWWNSRRSIWALQGCYGERWVVEAFNTVSYILLAWGHSSGPSPGCSLSESCLSLSPPSLSILAPRSHPRIRLPPPPSCCCCPCAPWGRPRPRRRRVGRARDGRGSGRAASARTRRRRSRRAEAEGRAAREKDAKCPRLCSAGRSTAQAGNERQHGDGITEYGVRTHK